jgi:hypothetical protein
MIGGWSLGAAGRAAQARGFANVRRRDQEGDLRMFEIRRSTCKPLDATFEAMLKYSSRR